MTWEMSKQDIKINRVALANANKRVIQRRTMAMKAIVPLMTGNLPLRISGMRAKIVKLRNMITIAVTPYRRYPRDLHPKPTVGVKTVMAVAAAVVPHWRIRAKIDAIEIERSAPEENTSSAR